MRRIVCRVATLVAAGLISSAVLLLTNKKTQPKPKEERS